MKSSQTKPKLEEIIQPMSAAQKFFRTLRKLGFKSVNFEEDHLSRLRVFAEKHAVIKSTKN